MLLAIIKSLRQLGDSDLRKIVLFTILLGIISIACCGGISWWLLDNMGILGFGFLDSLVPWIGTSLVLTVGLIFFPSTIMLISSFFADKIAYCVEAKYYPTRMGVRQVPIGDFIKSSLILILIAGILNICLLPFYALGLVLPGLSFVIFYTVNGYLIGRELFEAAATRHYSQSTTKKLRRRYFFRITFGGALITFLGTIPVVNLAAPVFGVGFMVHYFHELNNNQEP